MLSPNVSALCVFCRSELETVNHVFLHCHFIWKLWANLVNWWNYKWVSPGSVEGLLLSWIGTKMKKKMLAVWKALPIAVLWSVWRSRNDCVFNKVQPDWIALEDLIKDRVALRVSSSLKGFNYSVHDVIYNLSQVCHCV